MGFISSKKKDILSEWANQEKLSRKQREEIYEKTFVKKSKSTPTKGGIKFTKYGYRPDGGILAPEYLVRITSLRNRAIVIGVLQEDIQTRVESRWEPLIPSSLLTMGNILLQVGTKGQRGLITRASSRRIWVGSSPLSLSFTLHFEAIEDAFQDVVEPCRILQALVLPTEPAGRVLDYNELWDQVKGGHVTKALATLPTLGPPGPSPFNLEGILEAERSLNDLSETEIAEGLGGGDRIRVELGKFLTFENVIVREGSVKHHIRFTKEGDPISAEASIVFETYEMMTVEGLSKAYEKTAMSEEIS